MTGNKGLAKLQEKDGKTQIYLQLRPGESMILRTFNTAISSTEDWKYYQATNKKLTIDNNWKLSFVESHPAVTETFDIDTLGSWTNIDNEVLSKNMGTGRYSTTFNFKKEAGKEYRLSLGDVRESAKVTVNRKDAGTLFAVPFETNVGSLLVDGETIIEIDVTNLPANRIRDYDKCGVEWRIFNKINFVSITYKPTKFDIWEVIPSNLVGPVEIITLDKAI